ncbi:SseB family protein [Agrococcus sp. Marseille-P2731]|uniref:SseB family protein n=1 Tax=Agrococcus sp. Marseille-P2731 TaxID=1841862 RepID=UPI0009F9E481|nr:SseB family protein [Agrococcus sp. Marseille-P2731]
MSMDQVDNARLRRAITAFGADSSEQNMVEVIRAALVGELLLDATGSEFDLRGGSAQSGSKIRIRSSVGPDGRRAMLAFTSNAEVARMHPEGTQHQSLARPAASVLEMAKKQGAGWLYLDPADKTVALSAKDIDFALRHLRNDRLSAAIAAGESGGSREAILEALRADGPILLAGEVRGGEQRTDQPRLRMSERADGTRALLVFTSAPEIAARNPQDGVISTTTKRLREQLRTSTLFAGLVVNPAGPFVEVTREEFLGS